MYHSPIFCLTALLRETAHLAARREYRESLTHRYRARDAPAHQPDRQILALSPFRLGEEPNVRVGVAMITSAPEALSLHQKQAEGMWQRALKGANAAAFLRNLIARHRE